jgi:hypothetical protein
MNQIERDLFHNARSRLTVWMNDTIMRCKAIDIDRPTACTIIFSSLLDTLTMVAVETELTEEQLIHVIKTAYHVEAKIKKHKVG